MHWASCESRLCWKQEKDSSSLGKDPEKLAGWDLTVETQMQMSV